MRCPRLAASAVGVLVLAGCGAERPALAAPGEPAAGVVRSQKPEPEAPTIQRTTFDSAREPLPGVGAGKASVCVSIRAHVNGVPIFDDEVRAMCVQELAAAAQLAEPQRTEKQKEILQATLTHIIEREVVLQDALGKLANKSASQYLERLRSAASKHVDRMMKDWKARNHLRTDDELRAFLQQRLDINLGELRRQIERDYMASQYLRSRCFPAIERIGREELLEYYQAHADRFKTGDDVQWQDIFIDASRYPSKDAARQTAEQVAARARAGEAWDKLTTFDNGSAAYNHGMGPGRHRGEIQPPEVEPVLWQLKDGQVGPPVDTGNGYHVVRVVNRLYAGQLPFDEKTQQAIREKLEQEAYERERKRLLAELKSKASVEVAGATP